MLNGTNIANIICTDLNGQLIDVMFEQILQPKFVKDFTCAAGDCPDHCCHSWRINVDKKSFKKLKKIKEIPVKQITADYVKLTRDNEDAWGVINLDDNGYCPFLDESSLCNIHKTCGHEVLPHSCQQYPRNYFQVGQQAELSLSISCPSAAESVLFDPSAFLFEEVHPNKSLNAQSYIGFNSQTLPAGFTAIRNASFDIFMYDKLTIEQRLFAVGMLLKQSQQYIDNLTRLTEYIENFNGMILDGSIAELFDKLPNNYELKWQVLSSQDKKLLKETIVVQQEEKLIMSNSAQRFFACRQAFIDLLAELESDEQNQIYCLQQIEMQAKPLLDDFFEQHPHVLVNYFIYYFYHNYHNHVILSKSADLFSFFKIMSVDFFILKTYLGGMAIKQKELTKEALLTLFQSYSRRRQHETKFVENMNEQLEKVGSNSAGAIFGLLK